MTRPNPDMVTILLAKVAERTAVRIALAAGQAAYELAA
jgi:hypothetical protein